MRRPLKSSIRRQTRDAAGSSITKPRVASTGLGPAIANASWVGSTRGADAVEVSVVNHCAPGIASN
jgi:hypothetical protein